MSTARSHVRRGAMLLLALVLLAALWELYKLVIPDGGVKLGDSLILPRSDDASMPHLSQIVDVFGKQEVAGGDTVLSSVVSSVWYSLRLAAAGFAVGVCAGFLLALAMQRLRLVERGGLRATQRLVGAEWLKERVRSSCGAESDGSGLAGFGDQPIDPIDGFGRRGNRGSASFFRAPGSVWWRRSLHERPS